MNLNRYLVYFSYVGTRFSGVAKQLNALTVHNVIEKGIENLKNLCELKSPIYVSSRTDAGVHALSNTAHFDLQIKQAEHFSDNFKNLLNDSFIRNNYEIRILDMVRVREDFYCRSALGRTYLYRLGLSPVGADYSSQLESYQRVENALRKLNGLDGNLPGPVLNLPMRSLISPFDSQFTTEIREPFDYSRFLKAIKLLNGQHNFSAFTTLQGRDDMIKQRKNPVKTVRIKINENASQFLKEYVNKFDDEYRIIELEISAESFLYKMIRKMIGSAVDVAQGKISLNTIEQMFACPPDFYDQNLVQILKPNGLFLKNVHYDTKKILFDK